MEKHYQVGGHRFSISGEALAVAIEQLNGFEPFAEASPAIPDFIFRQEDSAVSLPAFKQMLYSFENDGTDNRFGITTHNGYLLELAPEKEQPLYLWTIHGEKTVHLYGNLSAPLVRFALWVGYGIMTAEQDTLAMHSSCIVYREKAVLFLGESGTGKSTHTRLWREYIKGSSLLNDDGPIVRHENGTIWVYGSPWSGKTPCYKAERYPLAGCVRLSQAPYNKIEKLNILQSFAALHPSVPPAFAYDGRLYDGMSRTLSHILQQTPIYHLACLPDRAAAELSLHTLYKNRP